MQEHGLFRRVFLAFGAHAFGRGVGILVQVFSAPVFIAYWGVQTYGEWLILSALPAYLAMSDLGLGSAAANDMTMRGARGDWRQAASLFFSCLVFLAGAGVAVMAAVTAVLPWVDVGALLNIKLIAGDSRMIVFVLTACVVVGIPGELFNGAFRAMGRYGEITFFSNTMMLVEFLAVMAAVLLGASPLAAAGVTLFVRTLRLCLATIFLLWLAPWIRKFAGRPSLSEVAGIAVPAVSFMSFPLGAALLYQGTILLLGINFGPAIVVLFTTTRTLARLQSMPAEMISLSILSEFSMAFGTGNTDLARKLHQRASQLVLWSAVTLGIVLLFFGQTIYSAWLGKDLRIDHGMLVVLLAVEAFHCLYQVNIVAIAAANRHVAIAMLYTLSAAIAIAASYGLAGSIGAVGMVGCILVVEAVMMIATTLTVLALTQSRLADYARNVIQFPLPFLLRLVATRSSKGA